MYELEKPRGLQKNIEMAAQIDYFLRLATLPVGVKFYGVNDTIPQLNAEKTDMKGTFCQYLAEVRYERCQPRRNFLIKRENLQCSYCPTVLGFEEWNETIDSGKMYEGVHFETAEGARKAQAAIPRIKANTMKAILIGPLFDLEVVPDIVMFAATPGMSNKIMEAQMWNTGNPKQSTYYNMCGVCSPAALAYNNRDLFLEFPCTGGRRMGLFGDNELVVSVNINFMDEWFLNLEKAYYTGHSYPIAPMVRFNPPPSPHFKILEWPDKIVPLDEWVKANVKKK